MEFKKTEIMMRKAHKQEQRQEPSILVHGNPLKVLDHFKQLSSQLSNDGSMRDEVGTE